MNYSSQYGQDRFLNENFFKNKKNGIFVDIGAHDGMTGSNSFFFEKFLNWKGLCVEPIPSVYETLVKNRSCFCEQVAIWKENCVKKFKIIEGYSEMLSGLTDCYHDEHKKRIFNEIRQFNQKENEILVNCVNINDLFSKFNLLKIDFLSIDVEGCEKDILESIDHSKYTIDFLTVENNYNDLSFREILKKSGFSLVKKLEIDEIYKRNNL